MFYVEDLLDPTVYGRIMTAANHAEPDRVPIWDNLIGFRLLQGGH